jgi:hypothetical protein
MNNKPIIYISAKSKNNLIVKSHMVTSMYYKLVAFAENENANYKFIGSPQNSNIINKLNKKSFSNHPFQGRWYAHAAGTKTSINQSLLDDRIFNE